MQLAQSKAQIEQMTQQMQAMQLEINNRAQVAQIREDGATKRTLMQVTAKAHETEASNAEQRNTEEMKISGRANETVIESNTRLQIESIKGKLALLLAEMDQGSLRVSSAEAIERAI
jgi:ABC-type phosphate/phosphonate transport system ATPase subunit